MRVLIHGINFSPELTGIGKYTGELAEWLSEENEVRVISSPPYYPEWKIKEQYKNFYNKKFEGNVEIIRCPLYVPSKPNTIKRFFHLVSFSISSFFPVIFSSLWKPNLVIQVVPTLFSCIQMIILAKIAKSKSVIHIQDFEVDAMFGLNMAKGKNLRRFALYIEKTILDQFDYVSTISDGMMKRLSKKGISKEKIIFLPNWTNLDDFKDASKDEEIIKNLGIDPKKKLVLYSGNMGDKQGLEIVIKAAAEMESFKDIQFVMIGSGSAKQSLESFSKSLDLKNVTFLPLQPYSNLPKILASADCHLIIQKKGVADLVLPSKLVNILAVGGNTVTTAEENSSLGRVYKDNKDIGVLIEPESTSALVEGIKKTLQMTTPNVIALQYAKKNLDKDNIISTFMNHLKN